MRFDQLVKYLIESTSPLRTMYHITSMGSIANILTMDKFMLSEQDETGKKLYPKYEYYMSTARVPSNSYFRNRLEVNCPKAILELDAAKFSDKGYPIKPIHDFIWLDTPNNKDKLDRFEHEDRILSKNSEIKNAKSFIKCINFLRPLGEKDSYEETSSDESCKRVKYTISKVYDIFIKSGIPTYEYSDVNDFKRLNKRNSRLLQ